jgi:transcriptional regulator with XRE-family HTH domain
MQRVAKRRLRQHDLLMEDQGGFAARLRLALKATGFSRGGAASALGVDKSLVGRWASGAVRPSEHNLSRITALVAQHVPGFTMADWEREPRDFAARIGIDARLAVSMELPTAAAEGLPPDFLESARIETARRGAGYEGFWRSTRPSVIMEGSLFHDHGMIRIAPGGLLQVRMGSAGLSFDGWALPSQGNLFAILYDPVGMTPLFVIFRTVPLPKVQSLDGLVLLAALDAARTPAAIPILLERIGDLSGDADADDAHFAGLVSRQAVAAEVPETLHRHLIRDVGPAAAAAGGDMFLTASAAARISRGATSTGELQG